MHDDELLRPTLTAEDDAVGFDRPWAPWSLVFAAFFCGPVGGGALFVWNTFRLGLRRELKPTALSFAALAVVFAVGAAAYLATVAGAAVDDRGIRLARHAVTVLLAILFARRQQQRFDMFEMSSDAGSAHLLGWGVLAFFVGRLFDSLLLVIALVAFGVDLEELHQ